MSNQFLLLKTRRFLPLFITQFLGAFHDNLFKNALVVLLLYGTATQTAYDPKILTSLAAGVFIFPYILFSALGGQMADKFSKEKLIRVIKIAEIFIAALGTISLLTVSVPLSFVTLFALGTHSAFFAPSKYAILPHHLETNELIGGNALVNTGTFLAILSGTMVGTAFVMLPNGQIIVSVMLFVVAICGYFASRNILPALPKAPEIKLNFNPITETHAILRQAFRQQKRIVLCVLGVSWFYFLGATFMAQFPNYTKEILNADEHVLTFFLALFSVGVAIGGLLNNRLLKGRVEGVYVPLAAVGITIFSIDLYAASHTAPQMQTLAMFLSVPWNWRIIADISFIGMFGGMFVVPLNAIIQYLAPEAERARILAGSAILDAIMIVMSSVVSAAMIGAGYNVHELFLAFALANACVAIYICKILPEFLMKSLLQGLFKMLYKVEVRGLENFEKAGNRAVIVSNHASLLDPPLLAAFLPGKPMFAVNSHVANWWWVRPFLKLVDFFPLDPTNPLSMKSLIRKVQENKHVVIFPEGRLTETGALMKVYDGPGMIADKAHAMILPVRLDGVQHTPFARLKGKVPLKNFPKITITILEPRVFKVDENIKGRARRAASGRKLYDLMEEMMFLTGDREQTLYEALLKAEHVNGDDAIIAEDVERRPMKFKKLVQGTIILGNKISKLTQRGENVGLMLPGSTGALVTFFALQAYGRIPAMLNFSAGSQAMLSACKTAKIKNVITSRRFIELARLKDTVEQLKDVNIIYIEDLKKQITWTDKLLTLQSPEKIHNKQRVKNSEPAIILFTSGSEGEPKGVVLSHANLMTNIVQLSSRADFNRQDIVFNCLPIFHSFGLTGGMLLPILSGIRTFFYPSPLHYRIVPELVYSANATIMFGTDTFLNGYGRMANPYDFYRMRYIFSGAEKLKEETRRLYMDRFGVQVFEGYGATETSPALAVNSSMHQKPGTVGRFLPGVEYRLEAVQGVNEGGRLFVRGPNVMLGYYLASNPGVLQPPTDGWHDTGDIVSIDDDGYVKILGRAKRFAKIAGEMVSLMLVETMAQTIWPDAQHAVTILPDARKGEQLALLTTQKDASRETLSAHAAKNGISGLAVPSIVISVDKMPMLATGKTDYSVVKSLIEEKMAKAA